ncbi:MAG TPA: imidazole glycerol phosphate synthase cyclase subunit [Gammaproteobacteria bacterium]
MTLARRIIPCFDLLKGRVVKGIRMQDVEDKADPVAVARAFEEQGADGLAILDVTGGGGRGDALAEVLARVSEQVFIPLTAGGGIGDCQEIRRMLDAGADKVMLNTAAFLDPELVRRAVDRFGGESIIGAVDVRRRKGGRSEAAWEVMTHGGRKATGTDARGWVQRLADYGVGEILLTSMDCDGTRKGFDLPLVETMAAISTVPLVVAGGAGEPEDIAAVLGDRLADGVMVASLFHSGKYTVDGVKEFLSLRGLDIRTG